MVQQEIKDWLRNAGSEVAKAAGQHVLKHGLAYMQDKLGKGMRDELYGLPHSQSGDGVKDFLKDAGRQIAGHIKDHLKDMAKQKIISLAKEHLGEGIKDVLKSAKNQLQDTAKTIGKSAAQKAVAHVADNLGKTSAKELVSGAAKAAATTLSIKSTLSLSLRLFFCQPCQPCPPKMLLILAVSKT